MKKLFLALSILTFTLSCSDSEKCKQGYTGSNCNNQIYPTKITVTKVTVSEFPSLDGSSATWDVGTGPDIYLVLYAGENLVYESDSYFEDASNSNTYEFEFTYDMNGSSIYTIELYDYDDLDDDDFIGNYEFLAYDDNEGFPKELVIGSGDLIFTFHVSYTWP